MEFFKSARTIRLRNAAHRKYLVADEDEAIVRQTSNGSVRQACWAIERVPGKPHLLRLRSCSGRYLSPTDDPYLFSISGKKVAR
ncbi:hypothetical protein MLD38_003765 [Melastoma candidum]|uniref:Uncharacterized protein n=1 Tax=Melastoma candidum TaxID=119954 RepID=A0ACB9S4Y9_9MYRT|nr:hypothetical protein MLD38_003765 [Melastoma candidum]